MNRKAFVAAPMLCLLASPLLAQPELNVSPGGIQGGNFVWNVGISPDFDLAGGDTAIAVELGFRLTGAPLLTATNINPSEFDTPNPGLPIFGWETLTDVGGGNFRPVGLQVNPASGEVFVAYGSEVLTTPGVTPFLQITAQGPANGGPLPASTIEWLGVYAVGHGRIAQLISGNAENFDIFAGSATQVIPEPTSAVLLMLGIAATATIAGRCSSQRRCG